MLTSRRKLFIPISIVIIFIVLVHIWTLDLFPRCVCDLEESTKKFSDELPAISERIKQITKCEDKTLKSRTAQRGQFWVLYNYVIAKRQFKCGESITYTTPADYIFLDNVLTVVERWLGPVSVALYAPGDDFQKTIDSIRYLRDCASPLIKEYVTFHVLFNTEHMPTEIPKQDTFDKEFNCTLKAPFYNVSSKMMYKARHNLTYPVNVARNIARETAQTHYVLPLDIELYPSPGLIERFLKMIIRKPQVLQGNTPEVFILSPFEIKSDQEIPKTKTKLQEMLRNKTAAPFHHNICSYCHDIPKALEWQKAKETENLNVFHVTKRVSFWEPVYIGTNNEPLYDERLTWNGKKDKIVHGYVLCLLDYDLKILDNAFLVHKPGIRVYKYDAVREKYAAETNRLVSNRISVEYKILYGQRNGCRL